MAVWWLGPGGPFIDPQSSERVSESPQAARLRNGFDVTTELLMDDVVTPWDAGIRFESPVIPAEREAGSFVVARWADWLGTRWEYRPGALRRIRDDEPWEP